MDFAKCRTFRLPVFPFLSSVSNCSEPASVALTLTLEELNKLGLSLFEKLRYLMRIDLDRYAKKFEGFWIGKVQMPIFYIFEKFLGSSV